MVAFVTPLSSLRRHDSFVGTTLQQAKADDNDKKKNALKVLGKKQGVYSRPSAAIERGSGFFIPGLEGPRVRLAVGLVLLAATAGNHALSSGTDDAPGNVLAEGLAVASSIFVLFQAAVEGIQEQQANIQIGSSSSSATTSKNKIASSTAATTTSLTEAWSKAATDDAAWRERVTWAARTLLALTAATQVLLIGPTGVVYRLSSSQTATANVSDTENTAAILALQDTLKQSTSGRLALPPTHPAAAAWAPQQECIVVQRIGTTTTTTADKDNDVDCYAWMVTSPVALAATLTQRDLTWLGPLAKYVMV